MHNIKHLIKTMKKDYHNYMKRQYLTLKKEHLKPMSWKENVNNFFKKIKIYIKVKNKWKTESDNYHNC